VSALDGAALLQLRDKAAVVAELLRQLANPTRLLLMCQIGQGERSVSQLEADTGLRQPGLSQQLAELRQSGLVKTRRESRLIFYSIADARAQALLQMLYTVFCAAEPSVDISAGAATAAAPNAQTPTSLTITGDAARFARVDH
jgi:DNA-binding transcriptional ArsR family regulator